MTNTKRIFCLILAVCTEFSLVACAGGNQQPAMEATEATPSPYAGVVADPKTWYEEFTSIPVANSSMTTDELRDICVRQFKANLGFAWTPSKPLSYTYTLLDKVKSINLPVGNAYSGLIYSTGVEGMEATNGNVFKVLSFYDKETGVVDVEAMGDKWLAILSSACSYGAMNAWNRVSNSHNLGNMGSYTIFDSNIVLVGPYTYEPYVYNYEFSSKNMNATTQIIRHNGLEVMFESYAQMLPADGLYSMPSYHVIMCSSVPVVVRDGEGMINPNESYVLICEQASGGTQSDKDNYQQLNGIAMRPLGTIDKKYTFMELVDKGYIPFTLKEFIGEDPVEAGEAWVGDKASGMENGSDVTASQIFQKQAVGNYNITNIIVKVKDPSGNELVSYDPAISTSPRTGSYALSLTEAYDEAKLSPHANGKNTIHICVQLANGELIDAFNTVLKMD